jgi:hypothetical protein
MANVMGAFRFTDPSFAVRALDRCTDWTLLAYALNIYMYKCTFHLKINFVVQTWPKYYMQSSLNLKYIYKIYCVSFHNKIYLQVKGTFVHVYIQGICEEGSVGTRSNKPSTFKRHFPSVSLLILMESILGLVS